jgi:hypothetical protein
MGKQSKKPKTQPNHTKPSPVTPHSSQNSSASTLIEATPSSVTATVPATAGGGSNRGADESRRDAFKLMIDAHKQITTLSAGALVLLGTFADKLLRHSASALIIVAAAWCLVVTIVASLFVTFTLSVILVPGVVTEPDEKKAYWATIIGLMCFALAFVLIAVFVTVNLLI